MWKPLTLSCAALALFLAIDPAAGGEPPAKVAAPAAWPAGAPKFAATTAEPVLLRYKAKAGQNVKFNMDMDMDMVLTMGVPPGMTMNIGMDMGMYGGYEVKSVDPNGDFQAQMMFDRITMKISGPQEMTFDTDKPDAASDPAMKSLAAMVKAPMSMKMSATGKPLAMDIKALTDAVEKTGDKKMVESLKESTEETMRGSFMQLPEKPLKAGDTYEAGEMVRALPGAGEMKAKLRYTVLAVSADKKQVLLRPGGEFKIVPKPGAPDTIKLESSAIDGWMLFDVAAGNLTRSAIDMTMKMNMVAGGQKADMDMKMKMKYGAGDK